MKDTSAAPLEYYEYTKKYITIHPETRALLEKILVLLKDRGMDIFDGSHRTGDEADALWAVSSGIVVIFPRLLDGWIIVDEAFRCAEN